MKKEDFFAIINVVMYMNYINNGDYYLVAKYNDIGIDIIPINQKWYLEDKILEDNKQFKNDISAIDIVTTKFENKEQMKEQMYKNGYIKEKNVDIFIIHKHKHNGKEYINEYKIVYKNIEKEERMQLLTDIAQKRLFGTKVDNEKINMFMNKFISKFNSSIAFREFMKNPYSRIDKYFINQLFKSRELGFNIKYNYQEKLETYPFVRNIISMWNIYDELEKKNANLYGTELATKIIHDYIEILDSRNDRKKYYNSLSTIIDKDNIPGQITINEYLEENNSYENKMQMMINEERALKEAPFDDKYIQILYDENGIEGVFSKLKSIDINKLSIGDKLRLGLIDYVEYKRLKRENGRKYH